MMKNNINLYLFSIFLGLFTVNPNTCGQQKKQRSLNNVSLRYSL